MLWAPPPRSELVTNNQLPKVLDNHCACSEELRKSRVSINSNPMQQDAQFWMSLGMSTKLVSSSLGSSKSMDLLSYTMVTLVL